MKNLLLTISMISYFATYSQVGIGTTNPTAALDVKGDAKIRTTTSSVNEAAARDSIIVVDGSFIRRVSSKTVVNSYLKSLVKGKFASGSTINIAIVSGAGKIPFNAVDFDSNLEFNTTTNTFTAKQNGIYEINIFIKADNPSVATNLGVAILKNGTVINRNSFANVNVTLVGNVTPPVRTIQTMVELIANDTITFNLLSSLLSVDLLTTSQDCFFTIQQVR